MHTYICNNIKMFKCSILNKAQNPNLQNSKNKNFSEIISVIVLQVKKLLVKKILSVLQFN